MRLSYGRIKVETFEVAGPILRGGVAMNRRQGRTFGLRQLGNELRTLQCITKCFSDQIKELGGQDAQHACAMLETRTECQSEKSKDLLEDGGVNGKIIIKIDI